MSAKNKSMMFKNIPAIAIAIMLLSFLGSCKKEVFSPELTREFSIQSTANGATYNIKVGLPVNYDPSVEKYATIYVLDGEEDFDFVSNQCKEITDKNAVENALVVGIGYGKDRSIDYTPTKISSVTGGAPEFLNFIETQLIPEMEEQFGADTARSSRVILGHSYGGLFGANVFCVANELFGNYILLSPSLWFDDLVSLQLEEDYREHNKDRSQLVFLGIGAAENLGRMQAPFEAFYQTLRDNYSAIQLTKNLEENLDHMGSKNPNIIKGLNYYFQNR
jgi:predicted alpha/beta superfamily hydrolase